MRSRSTARLRVAAGWTQLATAERAGLNLRHYQKIEGAEVNVTMHTLCKLASAFAVDPANLLRRPASR